MTTSMDLLDLVYAAVMAAGTAAGNRFYRPGDWPTQPDQYPIGKMRLAKEDRISLGRSGPAEFTTTAHVQISLAVSEPAKLDDAGAGDAETSLWALKRQVEVAVINSMPLFSVIQQIPVMRSQLQFAGQASTHLAGIQMDIALEFYEGPENFAPVDAVDLEEVEITMTTFPPTGLSIHLPTS
ncbi:MAG TPA: hypothetical protein VF503_09265 [Sphingobium sp.]|uniref:hypothetical protein n=1 Tax=Sphingobium sp. TaxID=1912891 RepID=UPI002ED2DDA7